METHQLEQETLGQRIKRLRKERGLSQIDLAKSCGVSNPWISQVEQDKVTPSASLLNDIAATFKISIRDLLQDEDERMELLSRIKLVEVLLETNQSEEAETMIANIEGHHELTEVDNVKLSVLLSECKYQKRQYSITVDILKPIIHGLESSNFHDAHLLAMIRNQIGKAYFQLRDFTNAFYNYQKAYEYTLRFDSFDLLSAKIAYNLAVALRNIKRSKEATFFLEQSHRFFKTNNDLAKLSQTFYEQGLLYKEIRDYSRAVESFDHAKSIMMALDLKSMATIVKHTLAYEITAKENPDLSLEQLYECVDLFHEMGDFARMVLVYSEIAAIHLQLEQYDETLVVLQKAEILASSLGSDCYPEVAMFLRVYAMYHFVCQSYHKSIEIAYKSYEIFGKMGLLLDQIDSLRIVVDSYQKTGQFEKALIFERQRSGLYALIRERGN